MYEKTPFIKTGKDLWFLVTERSNQLIQDGVQGRKQPESAVTAVNEWQYVHGISQWS